MPTRESGLHPGAGSSSSHSDPSTASCMFPDPNHITTTSSSTVIGSTTSPSASHIPLSSTQERIILRTLDRHLPGTSASGRAVPKVDIRLGREHATDVLHRTGVIGRSLPSRVTRTSALSSLLTLSLTELDALTAQHRSMLSLSSNLPDRGQKIRDKLELIAHVREAVARCEQEVDEEMNEITKRMDEMKMSDSSDNSSTNTNTSASASTSVSKSTPTSTSTSASASTSTPISTSSSSTSASTSIPTATSTSTATAIATSTSTSTSSTSTSTIPSTSSLLSDPHTHNIVLTAARHRYHLRHMSTATYGALKRDEIKTTSFQHITQIYANKRDTSVYAQTTSTSTSPQISPATSTAPSISATHNAYRHRAGPAVLPVAIAANIVRSQQESMMDYMSRVEASSSSTITRSRPRPRPSPFFDPDATDVDDIKQPSISHPYPSHDDDNDDEDDDLTLIPYVHHSEEERSDDEEDDVEDGAEEEEEDRQHHYDSRGELDPDQRRTLQQLRGTSSFSSDTSSSSSHHDPAFSAYLSQLESHLRAEQAAIQRQRIS